MAADWYFSRDNQQQGPVSLAALQELIASGQVQPDTLVWRNGMQTWTAASKVPDLQASGAASAEQAAAPAAPSPVLHYSMPQTEPLVVTPHAIEMLRQTRPWARFIAVLTFIGAGLMIVAALGLLVVGATVGRTRGAPPALLSLAYAAMALLYIAPAVYLNRYASRISDVLQLRRSDSLEQALEAQKSFWKFVGILFAIMIAVYLVIFIVAIGAGILAR